MSDTHQDARQNTIDAYTAFYEHLSPQTLNQLADIVSADIHFIDPFNDVHGYDQVHAVFTKMFADVQDPRFVILDVAWSGELCFIRWDFFCHANLVGDWKVRGMSELHFDQDGRINKHYDYWDSGQHFYAKLPLIGKVIRTIRRKVGIS